MSPLIKTGFDSYNFIYSISRYQREEAKIQAWVNLQNAKAEAQSKKLEVTHYRKILFFKQFV